MRISDWSSDVCSSDLPVIEVAVEPKTKADQEKMGIALNRLAQEDPSFRVTTDHESGQTIIKGMGELHLEILVDRMKREFKVEANVGAPQVKFTHRSEEHTSELQSLMRISYAVVCLKKKNTTINTYHLTRLHLQNI